jgi:tetratricopeptide (TPR) repeat protein
MRQSRDAAEQAIALDSSLAEAHNSLAVSLLMCDWDRTNSEKEFMHSLKLKPQNTLARICYGMYFLHWFAGRFEEALEQTRQAVLFDPLWAYARAMMAFAYLPLDVNKSLETAQETLRIDPDSFLGRWAQLAALNSLGRLAEAAEAGELTLRMSGRAPWVMGALARTYAASGKHGAAEALYMELKWRSKIEYVAPHVLGWAAWAVGAHDEAINLQREAVAVSDPSFIVARYWTDFAELREDARFQEILRSKGWK